MTGETINYKQPTPGVFADINMLRKELTAKGHDTHHLLEVKASRALIDIALDWVIIFGCTALVFYVSWWWALVAVPVIGGRQRATANLLHEAVHRNLSRNITVNNLIVNCFIAPPIFSNFEDYIKMHTQHHMKLGTEYDPENTLPQLGTRWKSWGGGFIKCFLTPVNWVFGLLGVLVHGLSVKSFLFIAIWWTVVTNALGWGIGWDFCLTFVALWFIARGMAFHAFTIFRTLCDHWGREGGGVFSKSREVLGSRFIRWFVHPYNNHHHLTHHLMPGVPYYHLPKAFELFQKTEIFQKNAVVCDAYFSGPKAVIRYQTVYHHD